MIVIREKYYSAWTTKAGYAGRKFLANATGAAKTAAIKARGMGNQILGRTKLGDQVIQGHALDKVKADTRKAVLGAKRAAVQSTHALEGLKTKTPGELARLGASKMAANPAASLTYAATSFLPVPSALVAGAAEKAAAKIPGYAQIASKLGDSVASGRAGDFIQTLGNHAVHYMGSL